MLRFSAQPGMWERQIQRKYENPRLFTGPDITQAMVDTARQRDARERQGFQEDFKQLCAEMATLQGAVESEKILQLKERIDKLYIECLAHRDMAAEKVALRKLHDVVITTLIQAVASDPLARDEIAQEQAAHQLHQELLEYPLVAQLLRVDSPIAKDDLLATLLAEPGVTFPGVLSLFDAQQLQELCRGAHSLLAAALAPDVDLAAMQARLQVMEGAARAMASELTL